MSSSHFTYCYRRHRDIGAGEALWWRTALSLEPTAWIRILALPLTSCVTLANSWCLATIKVARRRQNGVEGRELTSSYKNTKITTNCWTTTNKKKNSGNYQKKKDTLHPETKTKPQWDSRRDATAIKSNPIFTRWATHKLENNYIAEFLPQVWKFWAPHQSPHPL